MKKLLLTLMAIAAVGTAAVSCSKKDEPKQLMVSPSKLTMNATQTKKISVSGASGAVSYSSENKLIASVSDLGEVKANVVGETNIVVSSGNMKAMCSIVVKPKITFLKEPILKFGISSQEVMSILNSIGAKDISVDRKDGSIVCFIKQDDAEYSYLYAFEKGKLSLSAMAIDATSHSAQSFSEFIFERYYPVSRKGTYSANLISPNKDIIVSLEASTKSNRIMAFFAPASKP